VPLPDAISDEQGAMFFVNPITAQVLVHEMLRVRRGEWVLLTAAGSALGRSIVRMGRRDGFRTLCVVRGGPGVAGLQALGADAVVATTRQDLVAEVARLTDGKGVRHALDCVGGELAGQVLRCLGLAGQLVLYGTLADTPIALPSRDLMMPMTRVTGFLLPTWLAQQSPMRLLGVLRAVKRGLAAGVFHADVGETFPLEQVAVAVAASLRSGRTGKVMLRIAG
jgi:NADPH:quinone reductase